MTLPEPGQTDDATALAEQKLLRKQLEAELAELEAAFKAQETQTLELEKGKEKTLAALNLESTRWRQHYEYPSDAFSSFEAALQRSSADGVVLDILADVTVDAATTNLIGPIRLLGRPIEGRRPLMRCGQLVVKGDSKTDVWISGLDIVGCDQDEALIPNTRDMRWTADEVRQNVEELQGDGERPKREKVQPHERVERGEDLNERRSVMEVYGRGCFCITDCAIRGEGRHGLIVGGHVVAHCEGVELSNGLVVGLVAADDTNFTLERVHVRDCRREGVRVATAGSFQFQYGSIERCWDGMRIMGKEATASSVTLGPGVSICDCEKYGVRVTLSACASWAGGELERNGLGAVHAMKRCELAGWVTPRPPSSSDNGG